MQMKYLPKFTRIITDEYSFGISKSHRLINFMYATIQYAHM